MTDSKRLMKIISKLRRTPDAMANMEGSEKYHDISGKVYFYQTDYGVIVAADISGLPHSEENCGSRIFAFHIHSGNSCTGNMTDPFADAMAHYNPHNCLHPYHAGDLPPLFGNSGYAFQLFLTDRFYVSEIIGKTVIIHTAPDDFTTQPSGNSGEKIACGVIEAVNLY